MGQRWVVDPQCVMFFALFLLYLSSSLFENTCAGDYDPTVDEPQG